MPMLLAYVGIKFVSHIISGVHVPDTDGAISRLFLRGMRLSLAIALTSVPNSPK
jgi:hypothetical protein